MALPNIFDKQTSEEIVNRIQQLNAGSQALWGKMNVAQMLAHCNVTYEMVYEEGKHKKPGAFARFLIKLFVKNAVVSEKTYNKNGQTAPQFIIKDEKQFNLEKDRLIGFIRKTQELGGSYFNGKESHSFGPLTETEWNNMFYKHVDHHLRQFGV